MPILTVRIYSEQQALDLIPLEHQGIVSITEPGREATLKPGWTRLLRSQFVDSEYDEAEIRRNWNMRALHFAGCIRASHAMKILSFLEEVHADERISELVVHCWRGQSRSAAVARHAIERYQAKTECNISKYNKTVYELLRDPYLYRSTLEAEENTSWGTRFLEAIGISRRR